MRKYFTFFIIALVLIGCGDDLSYQEHIELYENHIDNAKENINDKRFQKAIIELDKAIEITDSIPIAFLLKGDCYFQLKEYDEAEDHYTEVIEKEGASSIAYKRRALNYYAQNDNDFLDDINQYILFNPDDEEALTLKRKYYLFNKDFKSAIQTYSNIIDKTPDSVELYIERHLLYMEIGSYNEALRDCAKALEVYPNKPELVNNKKRIEGVIEWQQKNKRTILVLLIAYALYVIVSFLVLRPIVIHKARTQIGGNYKITQDHLLWIIPIILTLIYFLYFISNVVRI